MSIEKLIEANTAAMIALTAALTAAGTVTAASTGTASTGDTASTDKPATGAGKGKGKGAAAAPKVSVEEMQAAVNEVKEKFGTAEAKSIIETAGGVKKMADIPEAKIEAVFKAAKAKLEEGDDDQGGDDDI